MTTDEPTKDSTVKVTVDVLGGGRLVKYLEPGESYTHGFDGPSKVETKALPAVPADKDDLDQCPDCESIDVETWRVQTYRSHKRKVKCHDCDKTYVL